MYFYSIFRSIIKITNKFTRKMLSDEKKNVDTIKECFVVVRIWNKLNDHPSLEMLVWAIIRVTNCKKKEKHIFPFFAKIRTAQHFHNYNIYNKSKQNFFFILLIVVKSTKLKRKIHETISIFCFFVYIFNRCVRVIY